VVVRKKA
jgi:hypothetical protein